MKTCKKCGELKPLESFYKAKNCADGHNGSCKICRASQNAAWANANPEKASARDRKWKKANPEKLRATGMRLRKANPEKGRAATRKWRLANPENVSKY